MLRRPSISVVRRFLIFGLSNIALSYAIFIGLGLLVSPQISHLIGYAVGLIFVWVLSNRVVFRGVASWRRSSAYISWYVLVMLLGQGIVWILAPSGIKELALTAGMLVAATVPLNLLAGITIFKPGV